MKIMCKYWSDCGVKSGGCCGLAPAPHGNRVSAGVCQNCKSYDGPTRMPASLMKPLPIPQDYVPTPANSTKGGCGCKK